MIARSTTNGVLKGYRYNLQRSTYTLNKARTTVMTERTFNSFAEDPSTAVRCFQLRRSFQRTNTQYSINESVVRKYDQAYSSMESVKDDITNSEEKSALVEILRGLNDPTGAGRNALGQALKATAKSVVQTMNCRYGDNFVFAGADGLNVPFTWNDDGGLCYRGIPVDSADGSKEMDYLNYLSTKEVKYADVGLGFQEDENGDIISSSAFNVALQGINFLGYGLDDEGDPQNVVSIINRMADIMLQCDPDSGEFPEENGVDLRTEFQRLAEKFELAQSKVSDKYTELTTESSFLKSNQQQLKSTAYTLEEQFLGIEDIDPAEAIMSFSYAQYCYNAALKVGNSVLSQSLMDYINT